MISKLKKKNIPEEVDLNSYYRQYLQKADYGRVNGNFRDPILSQEGFSNAELAFLDPQISTCFLLTVFQVMNKNLFFAPDPSLTKRRDIKKSQQITDFLNFSLKRVKGSITKLKFDLLTSKFFGTSFLELVYDVCSNGKYKGYYFYPRIKAKRTGLWDFSYDEKGNVNGYKSLISKDVFPLNKFMSMSWLPLWDNPNGSPDYVKIRKFFKAKSEYIVFVVSLGARQSKGKQSILKGDEDLSGGNNETHKEVLNKLNDYLSVYLPKSYEVEFNKFDTSLLKDFLDVLRWLDSQIAIAMLSNSLTTNENQKSGSYAMAKAQIETGTFTFTDYACTTIIDIFEEQYAKPLIDLNFDPDLFPEELYPVAKLESPEKIDHKYQAEVDEILQRLGILDLDTEVDLQNRRNLYNLPDNPELFEKNMKEDEIDMTEIINKIIDIENKNNLGNKLSTILKETYQSVNEPDLSMYDDDLDEEEE